MKKHLEFCETELSSSNPIHVLYDNGLSSPDSLSLIQKASGTFYTPSTLGNYLVRNVLNAFKSKSGVIRVCDPFAGDGRLVEWLVHEATKQQFDVCWEIQLWDIHEAGLLHAREIFEEIKLSGVELVYETWLGDSFHRLANEPKSFDIVITNPPWENLKPDRRELELLSDVRKDEYVASLRKTALHLEQAFPNSRAQKKYGGWGTNLSRVGAEAAQRAVKDSGVLGIVLPISFLADQATSGLRKWIIDNFEILDIGCFAAESRPFKDADVGACTFVTRNVRPAKIAPNVTFFMKDYSIQASEILTLEIEKLRGMNYVLPLGFGLSAAKLSQTFDNFPSFEEFLVDPEWKVWAGREIDETRIANHLSDEGGPLFIKGRMIGRYETVIAPTQHFQKEDWKIPNSVLHGRIVWRDVSRSSQKRRIIATCIPPGLVAGNSLGVAYVKDDDEEKLMILLGLMSSYPFELQLRAFLATGHISLASLRNVRLPNLVPSSRLGKALSVAVSDRLKNSELTDFRIEALSLLAYNLDFDDSEKVISCFPKVGMTERKSILNVYLQLSAEYANT